MNDSYLFWENVDTLKYMQAWKLWVFCVYFFHWHWVFFQSEFFFFMKKDSHIFSILCNNGVFSGLNCYLLHCYRSASIAYFCAPRKKIFLVERSGAKCAFGCVLSAHLWVIFFQFSGLYMQIGLLWLIVFVVFVKECRI